MRFFIVFFLLIVFHQPKLIGQDSFAHGIDKSSLTILLGNKGKEIFNKNPALIGVGMTWKNFKVGTWYYSCDSLILEINFATPFQLELIGIKDSFDVWLDAENDLATFDSILFHIDGGALHSEWANNEFIDTFAGGEKEDTTTNSQIINFLEFDFFGRKRNVKVIKTGKLNHICNGQFVLKIKGGKPHIEIFEYGYLLKRQ